MTTLHDFTMTGIDGEPVELARFAGSVVLVVNVASACGLTPQYEGLQRLYDTYGSRGLTVLGFPCNQFAGQEPGTDEEINRFACERFAVSFPMFSKIEVNGDGAAELYRWLTTSAPGDGESPDISWNFEKFLVGRDGAVVGRFGPMVTPEQIQDAIEAVL